MQDVLTLAIVGAIVSTLVQFIKSSAGTSRNVTVALVVGFSVVAGIIYQVLGDTEAWKAGLQVLLYANAVYGFLISRFE